MGRGAEVIHHGDLFNVLPTLEAESIDACVTDPPYDLTANKRGGSGAASLNLASPVGRSRISTGGGFMGKEWDGQGVAFKPETWQAVYRVLKPGAHLCAFGGTRTFHRMTCAIEDAGFEIRDCLSWLYGSGFPKSLDVGKAIDAIRDRSKLALLNAEIARARQQSGLSLKQISESMMAATSGRYGTWYHRGGHMFFETGMSLPSRPEWEHLRQVLPINPKFFDVYDAAEREVIGPSRFDKGGRGVGIIQGNTEYAATAPSTDAAKQWDGWGTALKPSWEPIILARKPLQGTVAANVQRHGTGAINIDACRIATSDVLSIGTNNRSNGAINFGMTGDSSDQHPMGRWPANVLLDEDAAALLDEQTGELISGAVAAETQRGAFGGNGIYGKANGDGMGRSYPTDSGGASRFYYVAKPSREERNYGTDRNGHPTVKPIEVIRWLVKLITPPNGTVLDPFMGSGTTGMACRYEQRAFLGIEREAEYFAIAKSRIEAVAPLFAEVV